MSPRDGLSAVLFAFNKYDDWEEARGNDFLMREPLARAARGKAVVAEGLALRILGGDYPPGKPLPNEASLLSEFGVSRTCLREALQMLGAKGLVRSRPKLGTFVREPHNWNFLDADLLRLRQRVVSKPVFLRELFAVRRMVEPETAALAAKNATPAMLAKLQIAVLDMARGHAQRTEQLTEADVAFHRLLLAASGNALLSGLGACIEEALRASISITSRPDVGSKFALDKHLAVFEAVCDGNAEAARNHMTALLNLTEEVLEKAGYGERA
jgi:GntR family transcriptional regulator, galactonate operon transcriptional repressor